MFIELSDLLKDEGVALAMNVVKLADGRLSVSVLPKGNWTNVALGTGVSLQGTPEELDAEFAQQIGRYASARMSLSEQMDATVKVIEAAKSKASSDASKAIAQASKPQSAKQAKTTESTSTVAAPAPAASQADGDGNEIELF